MHPDLTRLTALAEGVFVRADLVGTGHTVRELRTWLRERHVRQACRGVYAVGPVGTGPQDRLDDLTRGLARLHGERIAASHHSALLLHGLATYDVPMGVAQAVRTSSGMDSSAHLRIWRPRRTPEIVVVGGVRTVTAATAIAQVAAGYGLRPGVVAADSGLHRLRLSRAAIEAAVGLLGEGPGVGAARIMLERLDPGGQSPGESLLRLAAQDLGYAVQTQFPVLDQDGRAFAYADLRIKGTRSLWEFDGAMKYDGVQGREALVQEKIREDRIRARGWALDRVVWKELADVPQLAQRLRAAAAKLST
ncbi:MAG: hypothetical protein ACR2FV_00960 [Ornithinimicrobium sp.]|uniref:hypothetical protein n=1 Tax=Ornithinimicrobium sp. TaxID=1977084 RepID=UPI003D9BF73B